MIDTVMADNRQRNILHVWTTMVAILLAMLVLDAYLVQQNTGSRRTGILVMLLVGDICLLFILRYVGAWVGTEVLTPKRGCSITEWFLVMFVFQIKIYFILENVRKDCFRQVDDAVTSAFESTYGPQKSIFQPEITFRGNENMTTEDLMIAYAQIGIRSKYEAVLQQCDYSIWMKKVLSLFQATFIPGFYFLLLGADYLEQITSLQELDAVKMRAFWVIVDLLDLLDLQSSMWESRQGELPYMIVGLVYFYCYIILIILPPLSLADMSKGKESRSHEMLIYLITSFITINVAATVIRFVLLINNNFWSVSSVFIGKNFICIGIKVTKAIQIFCTKRCKLRFQRDEIEQYNLKDLISSSGNRPAASCTGARRSIAMSTNAGCETSPEKVEEHREFDGSDPQRNIGAADWNRSDDNSENLFLLRNKQCNELMAKLAEDQPISQSKASSSIEFNPNNISSWAEIGYFPAEKYQTPYNYDSKNANSSLNNRLSSLECSINPTLDMRIPQSLSGTIDVLSDSSSNEKKVRFTNEKLIPTSSLDPRTVIKKPANECTSELDVSDQLRPSINLHIPESSRISTSVTNSVSTIDDIQAWSANHGDEFQVPSSENRYQHSRQGTLLKSLSPRMKESEILFDDKYDSRITNFASLIPPPVLEDADPPLYANTIQRYECESISDEMQVSQQPKACKSTVSDGIESQTSRIMTSPSKSLSREMEIYKTPPSISTFENGYVNDSTEAPPAKDHNECDRLSDTCISKRWNFNYDHDTSRVGTSNSGPLSRTASPTGSIRIRSEMVSVASQTNILDMLDPENSL